MIVVSDTSVISGLIKIQELILLQKVFSTIFIPTKVWEELTLLKQFGYDLSELEQADWINICEVKDHSIINNLSSDLHHGEA